MSLARLNIELSADIKKFNRQLKTAQRNLQRTGRNLQTMGNSINRAITLPFAAAGIAGVKLASDLEKNFAKIQNLVGDSSKNLELYKKQLSGLSSEVGKSQQELSNALFTVTSAGIKGAQALEILEQSAKASAIGMGDTNEVARATTAIMTAFGDTGLTTSQAINQFTQIVRQGNLESESLAGVLGSVLGPAKALGVEFSDLGANIATMTRLGTSAEEATTGLGAILSALIKPAGTADEALAGVGWSMAELKKEVRERGLTATLIKLNDLFQGNEEALAKVIPNVRALRTVLGTAGAQGEAYADVLKEIKKDTDIVGEGFDNLSETSGFKMQQALVGLQNAGIKLGNTLLPVVNELADFTGRLAEKIGNLTDQQIKNRVAIVATVAGMGVMLTTVGKLITAFAMP